MKTTKAKAIFGVIISIVITVLACSPLDVDGPATHPTKIESE